MITFATEAPADGLTRREIERRCADIPSHNERLIERVRSRAVRLEGGSVTADRPAGAGREVPAAS